MRECPADELAGWQAFAEQDPVGWNPVWGPISELMSWMAAMRPFGPLEIPATAFLPRMVAVQPRPSPADAKVDRVAQVRAGGGKVIQPPPLIPYTPNKPKEG
jgi:hypothetical protein